MLVTEAFGIYAQRLAGGGEVVTIGTVIGLIGAGLMIWFSIKMHDAEAAKQAGVEKKRLVLEQRSCVVCRLSLQSGEVRDSQVRRQETARELSCSSCGTQWNESSA